MTAWIHRIDTLLPDFSFAQEEAMVKMQEWAPRKDSMPTWKLSTRTS